MKFNSWLLTFGALLVMASCVPNKKIVYLQQGDVNKKDLPKDSVVRSYDLQIKEYKIQPLDVLSIRIESLTEDEFNFIAKLYPSQQMGVQNIANPVVSGFVVDNQGEIEFPVVGKIQFLGLSIFEAQEKLQSVFKQFLKDPVARVRLLNFRFTILGEVNQERQVISDNMRVTLTEAIGMAGGLTDLADRSNLKIIRQTGSTSNVIYMNLLDESILESANYYVQQNDIIVVAALKQRPFRRYFGQNLAIFLSTVSIVLLTANLLK